MSRPLRIEFHGALYHLTSRGDRREDIFENNLDRFCFLHVLDEVCDTYNWVCHSYCLMGNHYHLLVETPDANLSKGMRQLNGVYTQRFNSRHQRVGHVFQGRYKAILVEKERHLLELSRYIVLNPVRARMVRTAGDWPWSSYRAVIGYTESPAFLESDWLLATFAAKRLEAITRYIEFVDNGDDQSAPWEHLKNQIYLGSDAYVEEQQARVAPDVDLSEVPSSQWRLKPQPLSHYEKITSGRDTAIVDAYKSGGYTLKEIGRHFRLHYSTVSGIVRKYKSKT
jgi:REP element-mobilizing transposase RayT